MSRIIESVSRGLFPDDLSRFYSGECNLDGIEFLNGGRHREVYAIKDTGIVVKVSCDYDANESEYDFWQTIKDTVDVRKYFVPTIAYARNHDGMSAVLQPQVTPMPRSGEFPKEVLEFLTSVYPDTWDYHDRRMRDIGQWSWVTSETVGTDYYYTAFEDYLNELMNPYGWAVTDLFGPNCCWNGKELQVLDYADVRF